MRLPLGILTGMGFIGGGAILKRGGLVVGVTTAATLWFVTVMGLCFGGGQLSLGMAAFVLGIAILSGLRWFDHHLKQEQHGTLTLTTEANLPSEDEIRRTAGKHGYRLTVASIAYPDQTQRRQIEFRLEWRSAPPKVDVPPFLAGLSSDPRVLSVFWKIG